MSHHSNKEERFAEFLSRLSAIPPASTRPEAFGQIASILNRVEDELSGVPFDPTGWKDDGRMYPPQEDSVRETSQPTVKRFRTRAHNVFLGENGAIRIEVVVSQEIVFTKAGADGRNIPDVS